MKREKNEASPILRSKGSSGVKFAEENENSPTQANSSKKTVSYGTLSPLVKENNNNNNSSSSSTFEDDEAAVTIGWGRAVCDIFPLALPAAATMAATYATPALVLLIVGQYLGAVAFAGVSVAYFIVSILQYPMTGLAFAMDTLIAKEFSRDDSSDRIGLFCQRGIIINLIVLAPLCYGLLHWSHPFLEAAFGWEIADVAQHFFSFVPLYWVAFVITTGISKFLCNQMQPGLPTVALFIGLFATPLIQYLALFYGGMTVRWVSIGFAATAWVQCILLLLFTFRDESLRASFGAVRIVAAINPCGKGLWQYLALGVPSAIFVFAEAAAFDVSELLAARLGIAQAAAWSAILNVLLVLVSASGGISVAVCALVGSSLEAQRPYDARRYAGAAVLLSLLFAAINCALIWYFFDSAVRAFSHSSEVAKLASHAKVLIPLWHTLDMVQYTLQGVFSGAGITHIGAWSLILSLWGVGAPLAYYLSSKHNFLVYVFGAENLGGLAGIPAGIVAGMAVELAVILLYLTAVVDWVALSENVARQMEAALTPEVSVDVSQGKEKLGQ